MTVRNTLLTAAKAKKFDKDGFSEKLENISGLNEKQWKENCRALIKQMDKLIKGKNISAGKHIAKYEKILNELEQKSALNKRQEKELAKLRKERQEEQNFHSLDDAVELLTAEGYSVTKNDGSSCLTNEGILNVLSYRYDRIKDEKKKRELEEKIKTHFPSLFETAGNKTEETDKNINEIAGMLGYDNSSKFASVFKAKMKCPPTEYRKQKVHLEHERLFGVEI